jgi:hypothetical protein
MDEPHLLAAVRYIALNPVVAGLASRAEEWPWSSARAHLAGADDELATVAPLRALIPDFAALLTAPGDPATTVRIPPSDDRSGRRNGSRRSSGGRVVPWPAANPAQSCDGIGTACGNLRYSENSSKLSPQLENLSSGRPTDATAVALSWPISSGAMSSALADHGRQLADFDARSRNLVIRCHNLAENPLFVQFCGGSDSSVP